jgi:hypothetical protein
MLQRGMSKLVLNKTRFRATKSATGRVQDFEKIREIAHELPVVARLTLIRSARTSAHQRDADVRMMSDQVR